MKNWKTTITGLVVGLIPMMDALFTAYNAGYFTEKTGYQLLLGIGFIIFGVIAKDHNVTGGNVNASDIGGGGIKNPPPTNP